MFLVPVEEVNRYFRLVNDLGDSKGFDPGLTFAVVVAENGVPLQANGV